MTDDEQRLVRSLQQHADRAPDGRAVVERVLAAAEYASADRARRPRLYPLLAAAAVVLVAAGVAAGAQLGTSAHRTPPAGSGTVPPPSSAPSIASVPVHTLPHGLEGFRVDDLTFVGTDYGWALGTVPCSGKRCAALARTTDGTHWKRVDGPQPELTACDDLPCVRNVRFATRRIGYLFGAGRLFLTTDGGGSWRAQSGGAVALETSSGNVIRVVAKGSGCDGPCGFRVETAPIGSASWTERALPASTGRGAGIFVVGGLARTGDAAYLLFVGRTNEDGDKAASNLYTSDNNGLSWMLRREPCPQPHGGREFDSAALSIAPDGTVVVACNNLFAQSGGFVAVSVDQGQTFARTAADLPRALTRAAAASRERIFANISSGLLRSVDGGTHFAVPDAAPSQADWIGFETPMTGRVVDGNDIWTTRDAGDTWTRFTFPA